MQKGTLEQTLLKSQPRSVRWYEPSNKKDIATALAVLSGQNFQHPVGVAMAIKPKTQAVTVAFSRADVVVVIPCSISGKEVMGWVAQQGAKLVGFNFERISVLFRAASGSDISGYDLLRLKWDKNDASSPGFAARSLFPAADPFAIDKLWYTVVCTKCVDKVSLRLRAWLTAW